MKLQNLTVIFVIIILPVILLVSLYISNGNKTIKYQSLYDTGLLTASHDAIYAFELNTTNDVYSDNAETKRNILKSSVKMFEKSLCNTCRISSYNTDEIEKYIPAIVFGLYDGFYMYAPSETNGEYKHNLKSFAYYSETLNDGTVINYSLDNYVTVYIKDGEKQIIKEGYLIVLNNSEPNGTKYKGIEINIADNAAIKYYKESYAFTNWFLNEVKMNDKAGYLNIGTDNDPEDESSAFVQHKREIIKNKIESVLNSSITAYSKKTGNTYKMPKLSEDDWQKIYSNISMISFFQGKNIGLTRYNGYCVLNSTNSNEYVNPNLLYFTDENGKYHDIRCSEKGNDLNGYKIGSFRKKKVQKQENGVTIEAYDYDHKEDACYSCINGQSGFESNKSIIDYLNDANNNARTAYWTSIARERYNTPKLIDTTGVITYKLTGLRTSNNQMVAQCGESFSTEIIPTNTLTNRRPKEIKVIMNDKVLNGGYTYNEVNGKIEIWQVTGDIIIEAATVKDETNISFENADEIKSNEIINGNKAELKTVIDQKQRVRVYKITPSERGTYMFWSEDKVANEYNTDPYAYLYDGSAYSLETFDNAITEYANSTIIQGSTDANSIFVNSDKITPLIYDDDSGVGYNFKMNWECEAGKTYYLVIRTYSPDRMQSFSPVCIQKIN